MGNQVPVKTSGKRDQGIPCLRPVANSGGLKCRVEGGVGIFRGAAGVNRKRRRRCRVCATDSRIEKVSFLLPCFASDLAELFVPSLFAALPFDQRPENKIHVVSVFRELVETALIDDVAVGEFKGDFLGVGHDLLVFFDRILFLSCREVCEEVVILSLLEEFSFF